MCIHLLVANPGYYVIRISKYNRRVKTSVVITKSLKNCVETKASQNLINFLALFRLDLKGEFSLSTLSVLEVHLRRTSVCNGTVPVC